MEPSFFPGETVLVIKKIFSIISVGDVVVLYDPRTKKQILKRVSKIKNTMYFVLGDNANESTDSRVFGWVFKSAIIGRVIYPKR